MGSFLSVFFVDSRIASSFVLNFFVAACALTRLRRKLCLIQSRRRCCRCCRLALSCCWSLCAGLRPSHRQPGAARTAEVDRAGRRAKAQARDAERAAQDRAHRVAVPLPPQRRRDGREQARRWHPSLCRRRREARGPTSRPPHGLIPFPDPRRACLAPVCVLRIAASPKTPAVGG